MKRFVPAIIVVAFLSFFIGVSLITWAMYQSITPCATMAEYGGTYRPGLETGDIEWEMVNGRMTKCRVEKYLP